MCQGVQEVKYLIFAKGPRIKVRERGMYSRIEEFENIGVSGRKALYKYIRIHLEIYEKDFKICIRASKP